MSVLKPPITTAPFTTSGSYPMGRLMVDTLHMSEPDEHGNKYVIALICCFSRFIELYPVKDPSALAAARALLSHCGRYGFAEQLTSDQESEFVNGTIKSLLQMMGHKHSLTMAYSKEENAIVERANKEILRHLRGIIFDKNVAADWSDNLPLVQRIMNSSVHSSIGVTPASILFGNAIDLDRGIFSHSRRTTTCKKYSYQSGRLK
jgi:transposase InsO family protein